MTLGHKPATKVFHGIFCRRRQLNFFFCTIGFDVGAARMSVEETQAHVHQYWTLARTNMRDRTGGGFVGCYRIRAINFFCIDASSLCPGDKVAAPLNGRCGGNCPTIILDNYQDRQLIHCGLALKYIEVIGCNSTVAYSENDKLFTLMSL